MILKCEVQRELNYQQFEKIVARLQESEAEKEFCVSRKYAKKGFLRICAGCVKKSFFPKSKKNRRSMPQISFVYYYLVVTMDPACVLSGANAPLALFDPGEYRQLVGAFDQLIAEILGSHLPSLDEWTIRTVDYATDLVANDVDNSVTVLQYMDLFRQSMAPERMIEKIQLTDQYAIYNGSVVLRCYPLQNELRVHGCNGSESLAEAGNLVRIEVRCLRRKLAVIAKRYGYKHRLASLFIGKRLDLVILRTYAKKVFVGDDYYSVRQAVRRLDNCKALHSRSRSGCRNMLQAIERIGGLTKARAKWNQPKDNTIAVRIKDKRTNVRLKDDQLRRRLEQLHQAGINPVPIPVGWKIGYINNPFGPFLQQLELRQVNDLPKLPQKLKKTAKKSCGSEDEECFEDELLAF